MEKKNDAVKPYVARKTDSDLTCEQICSDGPERKKTGVEKRTADKQRAAKKAPSCAKENENPEPATKTAAENPTAPFYQKSNLNNASLCNENVQKSRVLRSALTPVSLGRNNAAMTKNDAKAGAAKPVNYEKCDRKAPEPSFSPAVCDNGVPALMPTPPQHTLEIIDTKSVGMTASHSVVSSSSSDLPPDQDVIISDETSNGNSPNDSTSVQSEISSRFTSAFTSIERLGKGGFGRVFKGTETLTDKDFAIKIVCYIKKALREAKALADISHTNIVRYYTCWLEDTGYQYDSEASSSCSSQSTDDSQMKYLYIQMELCSTKTLEVWIDEKNNQNVKKSLRDSKRREESLIILIQIVSGVEYFHSKGFIHRDLKPANIMFGLDEKVKIGDFGLVTAENDDGAESLLERTAYKGTPSYMAPEQKSQKTYNRKVDIYALGLISFELFWKVSTRHELQELWENVRNQKFPCEFPALFLSEYKIIKPMLCEKPEKRPEASELKKDFADCVGRNNSQGKARHGSQSC